MRLSAYPYYSQLGHALVRLSSITNYTVGGDDNKGANSAMAFSEALAYLRWCTRKSMNILIHMLVRRAREGSTLSGVDV